MATPLYRNIYEDLKAKILNYTYSKGDQLPTDKELAQEYEVSIITIKNAMDLLKKDHLVSRKPRVGTIVLRNTEYDRAISSAKDRPLIGLIHAQFNETFGNEIFKTIIEYSSEEFDIVFKLSNGDSDKEEELLNQLIESGVQGIMLMPASSEFYSGRFLELVSDHFPFVLIDRVMDKIPTCSITIDNHLASVELVEYLFKYGHKKIGILTANTNITTNQERINGAISAHIKHNVPIKQSQILTDISSMVPNSVTTREEDIINIKEFLLREDITAIFAGEYAVAMLVRKAMDELGKELYKDYSLVCFDHFPMDDMMINSQIIIDHIEQDQKAIGESAVDIMKEKIENKDLIKKENAPHKLIQGFSVRSIVEDE